MTKPKSLVEELYSDSGAFDKERAVRTLKSILVIQRDAHTVFFKKEVVLKNEEKILAFALVKILLRSEGVVEQSGVSGKEIHEKTGIPKGAVDPTIQKLKRDGMLIGQGSNYEIPIHRMDAVVSRLEMKTKEK